MIKGLVFACALLALGSMAEAKDFCVVINSGPFFDSVFRLRNVKLGRGQFGPVHGYFASGIPGRGIFIWTALDGEALSSSTTGTLVVGLVAHPAALGLNGVPRFEGTMPGALGLSCEPGSDGRIGNADACTFVSNGTSEQAAVVDCINSPPLP